MTAAVALMQGMLAAGFAVAALFFAKFWAQTRDRLFAAFSIAFLLLAAHRVLIVAFAGATVDATWLYVLRLVAFLLILAAIIDKNRGRS